MKAEIIKAPRNFMPIKKPTVFLAGSIEMGKAENWQQKVEKALADLDIVILNPRRDDWDSSWTQSIDNQQFRFQVQWELLAMDTATVIAMYFDHTTKSPITLLELGLHAKSKKLVVCCPEGFWRKGNVDIVCKRYDVVTARDINDMIQKITFLLDTKRYLT